jgi:GDPmannose 4,6-dehydratase
MWMMLQPDVPDDYVVATGETHSVRDFCEMAFGFVGLDYRNYVVTDQLLHRPAEVDLLIGNPAKARKVLGWRTGTNFETLVQLMVEADCKAVGVPLGARTTIVG